MGRVGGRCRGGFALVELVLAVVILSIISAMAVPRFASSVCHQRVEAAAARVLSDLARAKRLARTTSSSRTVTFDLVRSSYRIDGLKSDDHPNQAHEVVLLDPPYRTRIGGWTLGSQTVRFDPFGSASVGGSFTLSCGGHVRTISVDAASGKAAKQ